MQIDISCLIRIIRHQLGAIRPIYQTANNACCMTCQNAALILRLAHTLSLSLSVLPIMNSQVCVCVCVCLCVCVRACVYTRCTTLPLSTQKGNKASLHRMMSGSRPISTSSTATAIICRSEKICCSVADSSHRFNHLAYLLRACFQCDCRTVW